MTLINLAPTMTSRRVKTDSSQQGWWLWSINPLALTLWPLSILFCALVYLRRTLYQRGMLHSYKPPVPVIVVGNISLGGNGKTPLVHGLLRLFSEKGYRVGILTRGYKSDLEREILILNHAQSDERAGDEANMLSELCGCPIAVGADRIQSAQTLLEKHSTINLLIADDGLQHYRLQRDIEIIVEREQAYGNGFCLPAGPMRESKGRRSMADFLIQRDSNQVIEHLGTCWNLADPDLKQDLSEFAGQTVAALAGIGFPQLFFDALSKVITLEQTYAFSDHHEYTRMELEPCLNQPLLVTHKDAVKIRPLLDHEALKNIWVVPLELTLSNDLQYRITHLLESISHG